MKSKIKELFIKYKKGITHFIKFNLVGLVNTGITILVYNLLLLLKINQVIVFPISYFSGVLNSYLMNKFWTFGNKKSFQLKEAGKFIIVNLIAYGGGQLFIYFNENNFHLWPPFAQLLTLIYSIPVNFIGSKYWVFKDQDSGESSDSDDVKNETKK
jgi:putative flippase GtrA